MDEEQLVRGLRSQDPGAMQELVVSHGDHLFRSACLLCGNQAEAQDLVQETLLQAVRSAPRFRGCSSVYTWLHGILLNLTRHYHRDRKRMVYDEESYEYLDGTLSPGAQAAVERHLSGCAACRQALRAERQIAQSLSDGFRRTTDSLQLPAVVQRRVLAALAHERYAPNEEQGSVFSWDRWVWPVPLGASVLLLLAGVFLYVWASRPQTGPSQPDLAEGGVSIQLSYVVPTYTFRREGGFVIDALTYQTNVVNERLPVELARLR